MSDGRFLSMPINKMHRNCSTGSHVSNKSSPYPRRACNERSRCGYSDISRSCSPVRAVSSSAIMASNGMSMAPMAKFEDEFHTEQSTNIKMPCLECEPSPICKTTARYRDGDEIETVPSEHSLSRRWSLWEKVADDHGAVSDESRGANHDYCQSCRQLKSFDTIENFMPVFNGMPKPSAIINGHKMVRSKVNESGGDGGDDSSDKHSSIPSGNSILGNIPLKIDDDSIHLDALMFFETGVIPVWEDPLHQNGGGLCQFTFKTDFPGVALDEIWERLVFTIIGNALTNADYITGVRMVDRIPTKGLKPSHPIIGVRLEVWHSCMPSKGHVDRLLSDCIEIITAPLNCGGESIAKKTVLKGAFSTKTQICYSRFVDNGRENYGRFGRDSV